jgi:hypothetical protein
VPAEGTPPQKVEHGTVFAYLRGSDQDIEDHPRLATIHHVVGLIAEFGLAPVYAHGSGIGVSGAHQVVGGPRAQPRGEGTLLAALARDPVFALLLIVLFESSVSGRGQRIGSSCLRAQEEVRRG